MSQLIATMTMIVLGTVALLSSASAAEGDATRGQRVYAPCAACHSLEPNRDMTGPSLAELWNRQAGGLASFPRYSPALKSSGIIWEDGTLDEFLKDPQQFLPGNQMTFPGVKNPQQRADLLAFLKVATQEGRAPPTRAQGRGGMMGSGEVPNLKTVDVNQRVSAITICGDTYRVTTAGRATCGNATCASRPIRAATDPRAARRPSSAPE